MDMKNLNNLYLCNRTGTYEAFTPTNETTIFNVHKDESIKLFILLFNNEINFKINLLDKGAKCQIECVYLTESTQHAHIMIDVVHVAPETHSMQIVKGILTDESCAVFNGVIRMPFNSQKCIGLQNHRAYVLSEKAKVQVIPKLEIYADDVQCTHGSAIGPLEKEHLFYLMARGMNEKMAQKLLLESSIIDIIPLEYHDTVRAWIDEHI